jgi:hypothetical protein
MGAGGRVSREVVRLKYARRGMGASPPGCYFPIGKAGMENERFLLHLHIRLLLYRGPFSLSSSCIPVHEKIR